MLSIHPTPEIWGADGLEKIYPDGRCEEQSVSEEALRLLACAETELEREGLSERMKCKLANVALH